MFTRAQLASAPKAKSSRLWVFILIFKPISTDIISFQCGACHKSHYHTPAYIPSDAHHLIIRNNCRLLGTAIPPDSLNAPLRFAPPPPPEPPPGPITCPVIGCSTKTGAAHKASRKCIEYQCKNCCTNSAVNAAEEGTYRDSCKAHGVDGVQGRLADDPPQPGPALVPPQLPIQPQPPVHPPVPLLRAGLGRGAPAIRGAPATRGAPANRGRVIPLSQPMSATWVNQRNVIRQQNGPDPKVERQRLERLAQYTCTFIVYHTVRYFLCFYTAKY